MEKTLVLIKPDGMKKKLVGKIIARFEQENMQIVGLKILQLTRELLGTWYAHHADKPFFDQLCKFMMETPVVAMVLKGENVVNRVREMCGPTDSTKAPKGTLRGDWGTDVQQNLVHASDSPGRAEEEISLLFSSEELFE